MTSSKESSLKETLRQQGAAAGSAGLAPPPPLVQGPEDLQQQRQMWRWAMLCTQTSSKRSLAGAAASWPC
jgi:hypothetical protein